MVIYDLGMRKEIFEFVSGHRHMIAENFKLCVVGGNIQGDREVCPM